MNQPFSGGQLFQAPPHRGRRWAAIGTSIVLHVAILAAVLYLARETIAAAPPRASRLLAFVSTSPAPDPAFIVPLAPKTVTPARPSEPMPAFVEVAPANEPIVEPEPVVSEPRPVKVDPPMPVKFDPPKPVPPPVTVGMFATPVASARTTDPVRTVQSAGFDAPAARAPELKSVPAVTGGFDASAATANARPGSDRAAVVADAGFGTMNAAARPASPSRVIADAGFGGSQPSAPARSAAPQVVRDSGFDAPPPVPAAAQPARPPRIDVPVEILAKPTPAYTDEARALKLEGEVVLEVEFCAKGDVRVLRVVSGLGHGLDESATRAAEGIRFKPAQSGGRPVDFRSTVHIVFRLA